MSARLLRYGWDRVVLIYIIRGYPLYMHARNASPIQAKWDLIIGLCALRGALTVAVMLLGPVANATTLPSQMIRSCTSPGIKTCVALGCECPSGRR